MSPCLKLRALHSEILDVMSRCLEMQHQLDPLIERCHPEARVCATNLGHYLGLRQVDLRRMQNELGKLGLSSLGRSEGHVLRTLQAVAERLGEMIAIGESNEPPREIAKPPAFERAPSFEEAETLLHQHTKKLLGAHPPDRHVLVMITCPPAKDVTPAWAEAMLKAGMNCARINCSLGEPYELRQIATTIRQASQNVGIECRILFDLPGPKVRTRALFPGPSVLHLRRHKDVLGRTMDPTVVMLGGPSADALPIPPAWLGKLAVGDEIRFRDSAGRKRVIAVRATYKDHAEGTIEKSSYLATGTPLKWFRGKTKKGEAPCGLIPPKPFSVELGVGEQVTLLDAGAETEQRGPARAVFGLSMPGLLGSVALHDRVVFDDGKLSGLVIEKAPGKVVVQIAKAQTERVTLKDRKGISFPDSVLPLRFMTPQDTRALDAVIELADIIAFSFVRTALDVHEAIAAIRERRKEVGIVIKLETQQGFRELPDLLLALLTHSPVGLMIARGDLAVECGFERLAELQEELLWLCEACHLPVIWATQVLENLTQTGIPTRAEITDAAMAMRAECVMLNRGPHLQDATAALVSIIQKMEHHQYKKRTLFRPLHVAARNGKRPNDAQAETRQEMQAS